MYASVKYFYGEQFYPMRGCREWLAVRSSPLSCDFLPDQVAKLVGALFLFFVLALILLDGVDNLRA